MPPLSDELILGLLAKESSSRADNAAILEYFNEHPDLAERSAFCKHCYKQIYTYGIEPSIEKTRNMQIQLEQQLASAEEEVKRPFPQATELTEKSKRLAVLEGLLNMNDKDIVTDTEPEQQCQTDNRQRGQEER